MGVPGNADLLLFKQAAAAGGYSISRSLRFNSSDSAYLSRTPASAGNRKTWTWNGWVKRSKLGTEQSLFTSWADDNNRTIIRFNSGDAIQFLYQDAGTFYGATTTNLFRDVSAWYHFVFALDTASATSSNRVKLYVNGVEITSLTAFSSGIYPPQDTLYEINSTAEHLIGARRESGSLTNTYFDGYLADVFLIDGAALTPTSFGEFDATTGVWNPIAYTGSYGTNGFHLPFSDNSAATATTLGKDTSGNGNNFTPSNLSVTAGAGNDSLVDSPTNGTASSGGDAGGTVVGNYATLNPLDNGGATLTNGNLEQTFASADWRSVRGTIGVTSGKWYWEGTFTAGGTANADGIGFALNTASLTSYVGNTGSWSYIQGGVTRANGGGSVSYGASYTTGDVIGIALDLNAGTCTYYKNGTSQGQAFSGLSGTFFPCSDSYDNSKWVLNFGQRPFAYAAPSGFKSLNTANLPTPTILAGNTAFDTKLYTGNGGTQSISGLAFSPDLIWLKCRNVGRSHRLIDTVRGISYQLFSNATDGGSTYDATSYPSSVASTASDGFSLTNGGSDQYNSSGETYVSWCWDAGSSTVTNTAGSITSTVRANASAGFSVVTFTGTGANATIGHGGLANLSDGMIIVKNRSSATNWRVYHSALGNTKVIFLSTTGTPDTNSVYWNNTSPTSTVFSVGSDDGVNGNGNSMVAYCFAPVSGYASAFSYTGNGSTDGPMVYLGFRPRWILQKRTDAAGSWLLLDTARDTYNAAKNELFANSSIAEYTNTDEVDFLSNGFKVRCTFANLNASGGNFIGFAFAENPFSIARAR